MKQNSDLTRGFISHEIYNYGVHGNTLKKIILLVRASNIARDVEELEELILECCAAWCSMISYCHAHEKKVTVQQVVMQVLNQRLEERLNDIEEEYEDGVYRETEFKEHPFTTYRDGYITSRPNWRRR